MASYVIHIAVAQEINKVLKKDKKKLLIGSIAPDLSKLLGETKVKSHFLDSEQDLIPKIDRFLNKYKNNLDDDFVLGYYIHLYTDYLWFKYFTPKFYKNDTLTMANGTIIPATNEIKLQYLYKDYSIINNKIIDIYNINVEDFNINNLHLSNTIKEIDINKIDILIDKTKTFINEEINEEPKVITIEKIKEFIKESVDIILKNIENMKKS